MKSKWLYCSLALAWALSPATAAPQKNKPQAPATVPVAATPAPASEPGALPEPVRQHIALVFDKQVTPRFKTAPSGDVRVDRAAKELAELALPLIRAQYETWAREIQTAAPKLNVSQVAARAQARMLQAFAAWSLSSTGADHDALWLKALESPSACRRLHDQSSELEMRLQRLRSLSDAEWERALDHERSQLLRWGELQPTPKQAGFDLDAEVRRLRVAVKPPEPPLHPILAYWYLGEEKQFRRDAASAAPAQRCAWAQWVLWRELAVLPRQDAAGRLTALQSWRETLMLDALAITWSDPKAVLAQTTPDGSYPQLAYWFSLQGEAEVEVEIDALGKVQGARWIGGTPRVDGLPKGQRAAAFESLFALMSEALALRENPAAPKAEALVNGRMKAILPMRWSIPQ